MVAVIHQAPRQDAPAEALEVWLKQLGEGYHSAEQETFRRAITWALPQYGDQQTEEGSSLAEQSLGTAAILAGLKLDAESVTAAILLGTPLVTEDSQNLLMEHFSPTIAELVDGVLRMQQIQTLRAQQLTEQDQEAAYGVKQGEALRQMLLAMATDLRVVLIKLAERTQALRVLMKGDPEQRFKVAQLTLDLFAPLANRLGVWQLKWELEDLSLRAIDPVAYKEIAQGLEERRGDREEYIQTVMAQLSEELQRMGISGEVMGRPKHIYSIWKKMRSKKRSLSELYDIRAVRVLVPELKDCYAVLGLVHHLWTPIPKEFDDYIAKPKGNNYQSLHTGVIGPQGKALEVQIRTYAMHQHSEYGIAAHWRYKEGIRADKGFDEKIAWLRQVLEWKDEVADRNTLLHQFKAEAFQEAIYVLTPAGKVIDLPSGATPIDFAYHVHSNLGHRCRGAKVDGVLVPLNTPLQTGQRVEISAAKVGGPSRDWLNPALGFVSSHRARSKIRQWFNNLQKEEQIQQGRQMLEKTLQREGATAIKLEELATRAGFAKLEDFFIAVGRSDLGQKELQTAIHGKSEPTTDAELLEPVVLRESRIKSGKGILVVGVGQLLTALAKCCRPVPPDTIVGFVTRGKGISIHRQSCANLAAMKEVHPERLIDAAWGDTSHEHFAVSMEVLAQDRQGLLRDISDILTREKINLTAVSTQTKQNTAKMFFTVEVANNEQFRKMVTQVQEVAGVFSVQRR